jgi:hypothetical protein
LCSFTHFSIDRCCHHSFSPCFLVLISVIGALNACEFTPAQQFSSILLSP